jgi:hypothetical protein
MLFARFPLVVFWVVVWLYLRVLPGAAMTHEDIKHTLTMRPTTARDVLLAKVACAHYTLRVGLTRDHYLELVDALGLGGRPIRPRYPKGYK